MLDTWVLGRRPGLGLLLLLLLLLHVLLDCLQGGLMPCRCNRRVCRCMSRRAP